jgi:hypothetical protein
MITHTHTHTQCPLEGFLILFTYHLETLLSKDVRIHGCSLVPEGVYEQKCLRNTLLNHAVLADPSSSLELDKDCFSFVAVT